ncbi:MAG: D-2-hydroxyacid dehydrogenase, partial [Muribaculaceae bacterium]|nr:D-2-hydroxyacid dehydrogenase [Muribaculaceae bacterium]
MKIVILDAFTANPGDLSWDNLKRFGELEVYPRTSESEIVERCKDAEIVLTNKTPLSAETIGSLPALRYIGVLATGYNIVDVKAARERGIVVCNVPSYSTMSVAQNVFSLLLEITNSVAKYSAEVARGDWANCADFCFINTPLVELAGHQMGIVGYGAIGKRVAEIAMAFGMNVAAYTSKDPQEVAPVKKMTLPELLATSDVISLHCPLTPETKYMINADTLAQMKPSAILINTGRGPLVNEEELAQALKNGVIAAAGIDV